MLNAQGRETPIGAQAGRSSSIVLALATLAGVVQLYVLLQSNVIPLALRVWNNRTFPAKQRSAALAFGSDFAGFMRFAAETVPPDAKLVLPRPEQDSTFGNIGLIQYFLIPRQLINCPSSEMAEQEACILRLSGSDTYILAAGSFPPARAAQNSKTLIPYNEDWGVYIPSGG
jgi:hypothetical protein